MTVFDRSNVIPGEKALQALGNGFFGIDPPAALEAL